MRIHSFALFGFLFIGSDVQNKLQEPPMPEFAIEQNGTVNTLLSERTVLVLDKNPFSILFNSEAYTDESFHAARIALSVNEADLNKLQPGARISDIDFFSLGTGFATDGPYDPFYVSEGDGHHYVFYQKEGDKRAELISEKDGVLRLRCPINNLSVADEALPLNQIKINTLYLLLLYDANLNNTVDPGEYRTVSINFNEDGTVPRN
jgi:hypothetical protein